MLADVIFTRKNLHARDVALKPSFAAEKVVIIEWVLLIAIIRAVVTTIVVMDMTLIPGFAAEEVIVVIVVTGLIFIFVVLMLIISWIVRWRTVGGIIIEEIIIKVIIIVVLILCPVCHDVEGGSGHGFCGWWRVEVGGGVGPVVGDDVSAVCAAFLPCHPVWIRLPGVFCGPRYLSVSGVAVVGWDLFPRRWGDAIAWGHSVHGSPGSGAGRRAWERKDHGGVVGGLFHGCGVVIPSLPLVPMGTGLK